MYIFLIHFLISGKAQVVGNAILLTRRLVQVVCAARERESLVMERILRYSKGTSLPSREEDIPSILLSDVLGSHGLQTWLA